MEPRPCESRHDAITYFRYLADIHNAPSRAGGRRNRGARTTPLPADFGRSINKTFSFILPSLYVCLHRFSDLLTAPVQGGGCKTYCSAFHCMKKTTRKFIIFFSCPQDCPSLPRLIKFIKNPPRYLLTNSLDKFRVSMWFKI